MTERDPARLKAGAEVPPELQRALRALGTRDVASPRLMRVEDKLGALLDAPPPAPVAAATGVAALLRVSPRALLGTRLVVAALVVGTTAAVWLYRHSAPHAPVVPSAVDAAKPAPGPANEVVLPPPTEVITPVAQVDAPQASELPPSADEADRHADGRGATNRVPVSQRGRGALRTHGGRHRKQPLDRVTAAQPSAQGTLASAGSESGALDAASAPRDAPAPAAQLAPPPEQPVAQPSEPPPARQPSEVELLFSARQAIAEDPRAALRVLDQHAARFPDGMLAPEREVMAIEALRKLGQNAAAESRLHAFQARYPESLHRRRLERSSDE